MNGVGVHSNGHSKNTNDFFVENGLEDIKQDIYEKWSLMLSKIFISISLLYLLAKIAWIRN